MDVPLSRRAFARSALVAGLTAAGLDAGLPRASAAAVPGGADWMGGLDSRLYLSQLTIPGTHDTCSRYGGALTETQSLAIPDQLAAGVRFLDIRCRVISGVFAIHHGVVFQHIFFGDVLNLCQAFLAQHPAETVLMRVKQEYSSATDAEFDGIFAGYQARWPGLFWAEDRIPQLGEVRGRVVVLADNSGLPGIAWGGPHTDIEDDYDIGTIFDFYSRKWPEVSAHLDAARASADPQRLFLTFTSSSGWGLWPGTAASAMAPRLSGYVSALNAPGRPVLGAVPMDFLTADTARQLYGLNFGA